MNEQPLNLRASLREIWRRRLLVIVVAVLCGLGGLMYGLLRPANETAVALVLLPPSTASAPATRATQATQARWGTASTPMPSSQEARRSWLRLVPRCRHHSGHWESRKLVTVTPLSGQILQIQAQTPASRYAAQLANAVAASYVDYIGQLEASSAGAAVATLQHESSLLTQQIKNLQAQIDTVTSRIASEGAGSNRRPTGYQSVGLTSERAESGLATTQQRHEPDHEHST